MRLGETVRGRKARRRVVYQATNAIVSLKGYDDYFCKDGDLRVAVSSATTSENGDGDRRGKETFAAFT